MARKLNKKTENEIQTKRGKKKFKRKLEPGPLPGSAAKGKVERPGGWDIESITDAMRGERGGSPSAMRLNRVYRKCGKGGPASGPRYSTRRSNGATHTPALIAIMSLISPHRYS